MKTKSNKTARAEFALSYLQSLVAKPLTKQDMDILFERIQAHLDLFGYASAEAVKHTDAIALLASQGYVFEFTSAYGMGPEATIAASERRRTSK